MANRFAVADTLGFQLYNDYLQKDIAEKRRKEEQERLERQRKKAKSHGAFGQTLSTLGQVGGAVVGGMTGGVPGAIAGAQLGQAGAGALFNLFPNIGGTQPSNDNPYYDAPSDMQRFGSVFNAGLQAYGQYSQAAKAEAMERVKNDLTAAIQSQGNAFKSMGRSDIQAMLEGLDSYKDAQGLFGESLIDSSTASSIANNVYDMKGQKALKHLEFLMSTKDSEQKSGAIREWLNSYGTAHSDLLPAGGIEAITAGIDQGIQDLADNRAKTQLSITSLAQSTALQAMDLADRGLQLRPDEKLAKEALQLKVKALSTGTSMEKLKASPAYAELDDVPDKLKPLASTYKSIVELSVATNERALEVKTAADKKDMLKWYYEQTSSLLEDIDPSPETEALRNQLGERLNAIDATLGITPTGEGGLQKQLDYQNMNVEAPEADKATDADARGLINQILYDKQNGGLRIDVTTDTIKKEILKYDSELKTPKARRAIELLNGDPDLLVKLKAEAEAKPPEEKLGPLDKVGKVLTSTVMNDGSKFDIIPSHVVGRPDVVDNGTAVENYTAQTNTAPAPKTSGSNQLELLMEDEPKQVAQASRQQVTTPTSTVPGQITSQSQPSPKVEDQRDKLATPSTVPGGGLLSDYQQIAAGPNLPEMKGIGSVNPKGPDLPEMKGIGSVRPPVAVGPNLPEMKGIGSVRPPVAVGPNLPEMKGIGSMRPPVKQTQLAEAPASAAKPDSLKAAGQGEEVLARVFSDNLTPEETGLVLEKAQQKRPQHLQKYAPVLIALATDSDNETAQMSAAQTIEQLTNEVRQFTSVDVAMNEDRADVLGDLTGQIQVLEDGRRGEVSMAELEQANGPTEQPQAVVQNQPPEATFLPVVTDQHDAMGTKRKGQKMPLYMLDQDPMVSETAPTQLAEDAAPKGKFDDLLFDGPAPTDPYGTLAHTRTEEIDEETSTSAPEAEAQQTEAPEKKVKLKLNVLREVSKRMDDLKTRINDAGGWGTLTDEYKDQMSSVMKVVQDTGERLVSLTESLNNAKDPSAQDLYRKSIQIKLDQADFLFKKIKDMEIEFDDMLVSQGKIPPVPKEVVDEVADATASTIDTTPTSIESLKAVYQVHFKDLQDYYVLTDNFIKRLSEIKTKTSDVKTANLIDMYIDRAKSLQSSMSGLPDAYRGPGRVQWDWYDTDEELKLKVDQQNTDQAIKAIQGLITKYHTLRSDYSTDYRKLGSK